MAGLEVIRQGTTSFTNDPNMMNHPSLDQFICLKGILALSGLLLYSLNGFENI
jgi:hypothetical protein